MNVIKKTFLENADPIVLNNNFDTQNPIKNHKLIKDLSCARIFMAH